ncbi:MAG: bifunctional methylenetetrahydrofolate dehydrogenase/methenyltetrahydrofolate cyclohydrolase FolD [Pseudomonadota bacterium]
MVANIIDGKKISAEIKQSIAEKIEQRIQKGLKRPGLAVVLVGEDPASQIYVKNKRKGCEQTNIYSMAIDLPKDTTQEELLKTIEELNQNEDIHGILVQFPPPPHIDRQAVIEAISPLKDVDGFHPYNLGHLAQKVPLLRPCTPYGVMKMLKTTGVDLAGKDVTIVGASTVVGLPMALEMLLEHCTPTICHHSTKDLPAKVRQADIVVAAAGKPELVKGEWIKEGAIVIDVGINRLPDGKLVGDVAFEEAKKRASWITPVPGGVGPMTIAILLSNTLEAAELAD